MNAFCQDFKTSFKKKITEYCEAKSQQRFSKDSEINEFLTTVIPFLSTKRSGLYCTSWSDIWYGTSPFCLASRIRGKIKAELF